MNGTMKTYPANIPLEADKVYLVFRRGLDTHDKHWLYSRPDDVLAWAELPKPPRYGRRKRKDDW